MLLHYLGKCPIFGENYTVFLKTLFILLALTGEISFTAEITPFHL